jgi:nitrogen fixation NifU-like protein
MSDLRELYQEMILDHGRHPRNQLFPADANCEAEGHNPLCGDRLTLKLRCVGEVVQEVGFQGQGCAISTASASTMTESIKGKTRAQIAEMFEAFQPPAEAHGLRGRVRVSDARQVRDPAVACAASSA